MLDWLFIILGMIFATMIIGFIVYMLWVTISYTIKDVGQGAAITVGIVLSVGLIVYSIFKFLNWLMSKGF